MNKKIESILEKLRKLTNLKESAVQLGNTGEANAAAAGIARLLMEYNLCEDDIPEQEKIDNPVISEKIPYAPPRYIGKWYIELVASVSVNNFCRALLITARGGGKASKHEQFEIVGRKRNVDTVLYLLSFLSNEFINIGLHEFPQYAKAMETLRMNNTNRASFMRSYLSGCVIGVNIKFNESKQQLNQDNSITALTLSRKHEIDDFLKDRVMGSYKPRKSNLNAMAAAKGIIAGKSIEITKGVHAERVSKDRMIS